MEYKNLMLVEGSDDQHVLRNLLNYHEIACIIPDPTEPYTEDIVIDQKQGVESVLESLKVILDDGSLEKLAIIVDADADVAARWDALKNIFACFGGKDIPHKPLAEGTIITLEQRYRNLDVGVWLRPDNQVPGILEDFVSFLIPNKREALWQYAKECVKNIPGEPPFPKVALSKAQIHTWLAWQKEPGLRLGQTIYAKYLNANAPYALNLVNWVKRVFALS